MEFSSITEVFVVLAVFWIMCGVNKYLAETSRDLDEMTGLARSPKRWMIIFVWPLITLGQIRYWLHDIFVYGVIGGWVGAAWGGSGALYDGGGVLRIFAFFAVFIVLGLILMLLAKMVGN